MPMNSPFHNIGIVTRPNTPEIQNTAHTLIHFLQGHGLTVYLDEIGIEERCIYVQDTVGCHIVSKSDLGKHCDLVIVLFLDEESQSLAMLIDFIGKPISLAVETAYTQEQYDIVLL